MRANLSATRQNSKPTSDAKPMQQQCNKRDDSTAKSDAEGDANAGAKTEARARANNAEAKR